mgnify:CR=1 FL=1
MAKRDTNSRFKASVSDENYTTKAMSEFTILDNDELKNMEEILKYIKAKKAV